jgi:inorganic pyrophosphatase
MEQIDDFWAHLDKLVVAHDIIIDRPKHSVHPRFPDFIYPVDYGYLRGTTAVDGNAIDVFKGTREDIGLDAIMCVVDLNKSDTEIKILYNCTETEKQLIVSIMNKKMRGIMVRRMK